MQSSSGCAFSALGEEDLCARVRALPGYVLARTLSREVSQSSRVVRSLAHPLARGVRDNSRRGMSVTVG